MYPRIYSKMEDLILNHLSLRQPPQYSIDRPHYTPFLNLENADVMLIGKVSKLGVLKGVTPASSGFVEDIAEMYNEKIRGINGKISGKSEGQFAVFVKGLKVIYSLDTREVGVMVCVFEDVFW